MVVYTFYRITHKDFPELNYVGSTLDLKYRIRKHCNDVYNPKRDSYRKNYTHTLEKPY